MKNCPSCGYANPPAGVKCCVCGRDLADVRVKAGQVPEKKLNLLFLAGLLFLLCGALFFFLQNYHAEKEALPGSRENAVADEISFSRYGVLYSLNKMEKLRFLPLTDKLRVPPLLSDPDDKVAYSAAKVIGAWSRSEKDAALARFWFGALLETASSGRAAVRRQSALEAGLTAALGFPVSPYLEQVRRASAGLVAQKETGLKAAGFFLSSMAGLEDLSGQMRETLLHDPSSGARLYAACALSRLDRAEGHAYLLKAASEKGSPVRSEALSCLSYSASPEAGGLLLSVSKDGSDAVSSEAAKRGLVLREQLAIIKK